MSKLNNGDMPAIPLIINGRVALGSDHAPNKDEMLLGLSKREQFAAMAMQGLLANSGFSDTLFRNRESLDSSFNKILAAAVMSADALLEELEK